MHTCCTRQNNLVTRYEQIYDQSRPKEPRHDPMNMLRDAAIQEELEIEERTVECVPYQIESKKQNKRESNNATIRCCGGMHASI